MAVMKETRRSCRFLGFFYINVFEPTEYLENSSINTRILPLCVGAVVAHQHMCNPAVSVVGPPRWEVRRFFASISQYR